jgi:hypothetical protein
MFRLTALMSHDQALVCFLKVLEAMHAKLKFGGLPVGDDPRRALTVHSCAFARNLPLTNELYITFAGIKLFHA